MWSLFIALIQVNLNRLALIFEYCYYTSVDFFELFEKITSFYLFKSTSPFFLIGPIPSPSMQEVKTGKVEVAEINATSSNPSLFIYLFIGIS